MNHDNAVAKCKILLVDDDREFRKSVEILLSRNNYDVVSAEGVGQALQVMQENNFDLLITDLKMTDGSGMDLLSKARIINPDLAVIIQTAYGSISGAVEAMRQGRTIISPSRSKMKSS